MWAINILIIVILGFISAAFAVEDFISFPSLNRAADIGHFYDEISDTLHLVKAVRGDFPINSTYFVNTPTVNFVYKSIHSFADQLEAINVDISAQASLLVGKVDAGGSYSYISEVQMESDNNYAVLSYQTKITTEILALHKVNVLQKLDTSIGSYFGATHIIIGVEWGTSTLFSVNWKTSSNDSSASQSVNANIAISSPTYSVAMSSTLQSLKKSAKKNKELDIRMFGNFVLRNLSFKSFEDIEAFIAQVPSYTAKVNAGKGSPLKFIAISINKLDQILKKYYSPLTEEQVKAEISSISSSVSMPLFKLYSRMIADFKAQKETLRQFREYYSQAVKYEDILPTGSAVMLKGQIQEYEIAHGIFRLKSQDLLKFSHNSSVQVLIEYEKIQKEYQEDPNGEPIISVINKINTKNTERIKDYLWFSGFRVHVLKKTEGINEMIVSHRQKKNVYVFYSTQRAKHDAGNKWYRHVEEFVQLRGFKIYVDCGICACREVTKQKIIDNPLQPIGFFASLKPKPLAYYLQLCFLIRTPSSLCDALSNSE